MNSDDVKRFCLVTLGALLRAFAAIWISPDLFPRVAALPERWCCREA
jgi:hypothetical protein